MQPVSTDNEISLVKNLQRFFSSLITIRYVIDERGAEYLEFNNEDEH